MSKTVAATSQHIASNNTTSANPAHYLMWFRRDLRVHDNTALAALCERANEDSARVSAIFFMTPEQWHAHDMSLTQLDHIARTLPLLATSLQKHLNINLTVQLCASFSDCVETLSTLCEVNDISLVMANHEYEGNEIDRDQELTKQLAKSDIEFIRWHDQCILPPKTITTNDDSMYQVFTPFYNKWRHTLDVSNLQMHQAMAVNYQSKISQSKTTLKTAKESANTVKDIEQLSKKAVEDYQKRLETALAHQHIDFGAQLEHARTAYPAGEGAARQRLEDFIADDIDNYDISRDVPNLQATSQLSAYLTIGAISPRLCYLQATKALERLQDNDSNNFDSFDKSDNNDINRWISHPSVLKLSAKINVLILYGGL